MKYSLIAVVVIVVLAVSTVVITNRAITHKKEFKIKQAQEQKLLEEAQLQKQREEADRARIAQEKKAKEAAMAKASQKKKAEEEDAAMAKALQEKKAKEEAEKAEKVDQYKNRLALAEKEVVDANSVCSSLAEKINEAKKKVLITQGQWKTLDEKAKALEHQAETAERRQPESVPSRPAGLRGRQPESVPSRPGLSSNGFAAKAAEARAAADRKKNILDSLITELTESENELAAAQSALQTKKDALEAIKKENLGENIDVAIDSKGG